MVTSHLSSELQVMAGSPWAAGPGLALAPQYLQSPAQPWSAARPARPIRCPISAPDLIFTTAAIWGALTKMATIQWIMAHYCHLFLYFPQGQLARMLPKSPEADKALPSVSERHWEESQWWHLDGASNTLWTDSGVKEVCSPPKLIFETFCGFVHISLVVTFFVLRV